MSKPAKSGYTKVTKPFINDYKLMIKTNEVDGKIVSFDVRYKDKAYNFKVVGHNILEAWKKIEHLTKDL